MNSSWQLCMRVTFFSTPINAAGYISIVGRKKTPQSKVRPLWKFCAALQACTTRVRGQIRLVQTGSMSFLWALLLGRTFPPIAIWMHYFGVNNLKRSWMDDNPMHLSPKHTGVRSGIFFFLPLCVICNIRRVNWSWMVVPVGSLWAVNGQGEAARRTRPLGFTDS